MFYLFINGIIYYYVITRFDSVARLPRRYHNLHRPVVATPSRRHHQQLPSFVVRIRGVARSICPISLIAANAKEQNIAGHHADKHRDRMNGTPPAVICRCALPAIPDSKWQSTNKQQKKEYRKQTTMGNCVRVAFTAVGHRSFGSLGTSSTFHPAQGIAVRPSSIECHNAYQFRSHVTCDSSKHNKTKYMPTIIKCWSE